MRGRSDASVDARRTRPRLSGRMHTTWKVMPDLDMPWSPICLYALTPSGVAPRPGTNLICRSGAASPGLVRKKPPWSQPTDVSGPCPRRAHLSSCDERTRLVPGTKRSSVMDDPGSVSCATTTAGWSWRLQPTLGELATTSRPRSLRSSAGPTPLSMSILGEEMAPPQSTTSPPGASSTRFTPPPRSSYSTPVAARDSSKSTRRTLEEVRTRTVGGVWRPRKPVYASERLPRRCMVSNLPTPSCGEVQSLKSLDTRWPCWRHASRKAAESGLWYGTSDTDTGPPRPWWGEAPEVWSSERLK
mmetsp:Transcript_7084/g.23852  ORF Transcript_7084/g.23852 Transcript_7084/m.23852 type:complete len:301 (+) Transcript_7084:470-1372(+)